jgi:uncharacterized protein YhbP (UPF0306 family)
MSELDTRAVVQGFLEIQSTLTLATVSPEGKPEAAPLFYVSDDRLNLYWLSSPNSRHSVNLVVHPQVAATIYPSVWNWTDIVGLQIEGEARPMGDERMREQILILYLRKFQLPPEMDVAISTSTLYQLTPTWIRWLDNSVKFGYKTELNLEAPAPGD